MCIRGDRIGELLPGQVIISADSRSMNGVFESVQIPLFQADAR